MKRFQENLIRVGMVMGLWMGIGMVAASSMAAACGLATGMTVFTAGLLDDVIERLKAGEDA